MDSFCNDYPSQIISPVNDVITLDWYATGSGKIRSDMVHKLFRQNGASLNDYTKHVLAEFPSQSSILEFFHICLIVIYFR